MTTQTPTKKTLSEIKAQLEIRGISQIFHTEKGIVAFSNTSGNKPGERIMGISREGKWNNEIFKSYTTEEKFFSAIARNLKGQA